MNQIIERARRGEATPAELAELDAWRARSTANEREYHALLALIEAAGALGTADAQRAAPSAQQLLALAPRIPLARSRPQPRPAWLPWGVAAAAVLALAIVTGRSLTRAPASAWAAAEVTTSSTELATLQLGDGSVVRLGPDSRLTMTGPREVALEGQGFFTIARAAGRSFRVRTSHGQVRVLGTRFELNTHGEALSLVVVEGRVALSADGEDVEVKGGEVSGVVAGTLLPPQPVQNPDSTLRWVGRFLVFQSTPLAQAAAEVERIYGVQVRVDDPELAQRTVTATFTNRSLDHVLGVLCTVVNGRCSGREGTYHITR